jgi:signal peptidase II
VGSQKSQAAVLATFIVATDLATKAWALRALDGGRQIELLGGLLPLTLAFNTGAAFGITIGDDPRWVFVPVTLVAIGFLLVLIARAGPLDRLRTFASALVLGGALGNLYDRMRWDRGVVDWIGPIDLGFMYWPIFNVADMAITVGAILLAIAFWQEERRHARDEAAESETSSQRSSASA